MLVSHMHNVNVACPTQQAAIPFTPGALFSADSTDRSLPCPMQAVSFAAKMLQSCSPISQCILDGQLSKAQQMLERANRLWQPASKPAQEISRCCSPPPVCCREVCISAATANLVDLSPSFVCLTTRPLTYCSAPTAQRVSFLLYQCAQLAFKDVKPPGELSGVSMQACSSGRGATGHGVQLGSAAAIHHCLPGGPGYCHPAAHHCRHQQLAGLSPNPTLTLILSLNPTLTLTLTLTFTLTLTLPDHAHPHPHPAGPCSPSPSP